MDLHERILNAANQIEQPADRPLITLSYAQSLDGSIAAKRGQRTQISGPESALLTHHLRANHDAILIGIGALLADDPQLSVRLVEGENPKPVILDSKLRTPINSFVMRSNPPWIATTEGIDQGQARKLSSLGAKMFYLPASPSGFIHLDALLETLYHEGIKRLMVEGGAKVLTSFLETQLVDLVVATIAPLILGGLPAVQFPSSAETTAKLGSMPRLEKMNVVQAGEDIIVFGSPRWVAANEI